MSVTVQSLFLEKSSDFSIVFIQLMRESFFLKFPIGFYRLLEDLFLDSFFVKLYPKNIRLPAWLEKSFLASKSLFSPLLLALAFLLFVALGSYPLLILTRIAIIGGLASFALFSFLPGILKKSVKPPVFKTESLGAIGFLLYVTGALFVMMSIVKVGGIPLLRSSLRYRLSPALTVFTSLLVPGLAILTASFADLAKKGKLGIERARFRTLLYTVSAVILILLLGYRTPALALILVAIITGYFSGLFAFWEVLSGVLAALLLITGFGYMRAAGEYFMNLSALDLLRARAAFTLQVLDKLVNISGLTGITHGGLRYSMLPGPGMGPRFLIARLIDWRSGVTITCTLLGPMAVDFGVAGVIAEMGFLGFLLGLGYRLAVKGQSYWAAFYAILLSYALIGIETGLLDLVVYLFFAVIGLFYLYALLKNS